MDLAAALEAPRVTHRRGNDIIVSRGIDCGVGVDGRVVDGARGVGGIDHGISSARANDLFASVADTGPRAESLEVAALKSVIAENIKNRLILGEALAVDDVLAEGDDILIGVHRGGRIR